MQERECEEKKKKEKEEKKKKNRNLASTFSQKQEHVKHLSLINAHSSFLTLTS